MTFSLLRLTSFCSIFLLIFIFSSCQKDSDKGKQVADFSNEASLEWNKMYLEVERYAGGYRPGPAPRSLAYLGLAAYEACITGMPDYNSMESRYAGLNIPDVEEGKEYHWPSVIHGVYQTLMHSFFTNVSADMSSRMNSLESSLDSKYEAEAGEKTFGRSKAYGIAVAEAVWAYSATDLVAHDAYLDPFANYDWATHYDSPGDWVPTVPGPPQPMFPHWGEVRTFAITEQDKLCKEPLPYSEDHQSALWAQGLEVYNATNDANWEDGQWIAFYWSDDLVNLTFSPGPRFISIANQAAEAEDIDLETALFMYAKLGMALNDAAVACWHSKYAYNFERPESYIQRLMDPSWEPTLVNPLNGWTGFTPPFPAYPSGHSTMGGAGAEVLTDIFSNHYGMLDRSHEGRTEFNGTPRYFDNFYQMAEENAISRVPLGVHWRMDCEVGVDLGYLCGRRVNSMDWKK